MKAYKLEILVVDHNGNGISDIINTIKNNKYYTPKIISHSETDIGEWSDEHPLNQRNCTPNCLNSYFENENE